MYCLTRHPYSGSGSNDIVYRLFIGSQCIYSNYDDKHRLLRELLLFVQNNKTRVFHVNILKKITLLPNGIQNNK